jgi:hypothetical protein
MRGYAAWLRKVPFGGRPFATVYDMGFEAMNGSLSII